MRTTIIALLLLLTACVSTALSGEAFDSGRDMIKKRVPFEIGTDGECYVVGACHKGVLSKLTVSIGLSSARLEWVFSSNGGLSRFSVTRNYYLWDEGSGGFRPAKIDHKRSVIYEIDGKKIVKKAADDRSNLADDEWTLDEIYKVFSLAKTYLKSGDRKEFEMRLKALVRK